MLDEARRRLSRFGGRITFIQADLGQPLPITTPVDAILSTATFHWGPYDGALFRNLAAVLRPGGQLVAQCGGAGNIDRLDRIVRELIPDDGVRLTFATPGETRARLDAAGFADVAAWLVNAPIRLERDGPLENLSR